MRPLIRKINQKLTKPDSRDCEEVRELMSDYLDDELNADSRDHIDDHVGICPGCQRVLGNLRMTLQQVALLSAALYAGASEPDEVAERIARTWR